MNSTHATVGIGATSAMAALTTLLDGLHGLPSDKAAAAAWLVVTGGGGIYALVVWWVQWRWPTLPPLPGEIVALPQQGGQPAVPAQVIEQPTAPPTLQPAPLAERLVPRELPAVSPTTSQQGQSA